MSKIIGGIFTVVGGLTAMYLAFLWGNTSNVLEYNDPAKHQTILQTGLAIPIFFTVLILSIGLTFMFVSKEPNTK